MTIPWSVRADEAARQAKELREQARSMPMRTHKRKATLQAARAMEGKAQFYLTKAEQPQ